ncbi:7-carboxy-7-deazaguanine synthase QueE [Zoogloea sp.]|uniref:7-carboxy-7-deazaguanine synthase QueE n=1 Tax=Zoogloea sp. TaxID=49181 RepID=UPI00261D53FC|nr:7-carboxy-7-deazaguanine synthase QueE [Zoogloea sp.]MDD3353143.1 7-carboxy-7-deazaguanine synthase QueE [Zoogloea sp.]
MSSTGRPVTLRITEIFHSLQGETSRTGLPTVFIRLTGCPLRCSWCDTEYAFTGGSPRNLDEILAEVAGYGCQTVCVTGGEPLSQKACLPLLTALCDAGYSVSLETSGALDISGVDPRVSRIMDLKAPGSGEEGRNLLANLPLLTLRDEVKLVLASEADYEWARAKMAEHHLTERCPVLMAPVQGQLKPADLAAWILRDRLPVRMQVQLHKIIWGNEPGR